MITPDNTRKEDNKGQDGEILGRFERGGSGGGRKILAGMDSIVLKEGTSEGRHLGKTITFKNIPSVAVDGVNCKEVWKW